MGWMRKAAAAFAAASVCMISAGAAEAQTKPAPQCRATCNTNYSACNRRSADSDACLRQWHACKRKCQGKPAAKPATDTSKTAPPKK